ncbi:GAF domain-containing protein [Candidatus Neomarinimicrobiota bacterium]
MTSDLKHYIYLKAINEIKLMLDEDGYVMDMIGKMATVATILHIHFPHWIFVGFYRRVEDNIMEIGPYQGSVIACTSIKIGRGVCGSAAQQKTVINVPDVSKYANHISCDDITKSEMVVPIIRNDNLIGVIDIDSPHLNDFNEIDERHILEIVEIL